MSSKLNLDRIIGARATKTVYRDGENAIKVFNSNYSKVDVLNEALNQARVENLGLNVPAIVEVTQTEDGRWVIISKYIKGTTLEQLMKDHKDKKQEYLELFVKLQLQVHSKTCPLLSKLKDKMNGKIAMADIDATSRYELRTRLEGMNRGNKLCHGDFNPSNIIIQDDGTAYILDWSHATQGVPAADAARTYLLFWLSGDINGADEYLDLYCKEAKIDKKEVQKWLPVVAASQSVKGNQKEREFLLSWINVSDYE
jgi:thiamine kinase-like enzyme